MRPTQSTLRIGLLGAARIAPAALVKPARAVEDVRVVAVAARDPERATRFASDHGIPVVHRHYQELIDDPDVDAIYNPLPNSLHHEWTLRALEAGKHVLCEKPMASNARAAQEMADAAQVAGRILMEAFHYRYHPVAARLREIIDGGAIGCVRRIDTFNCFPLLRPADIRYSYDLAGGALMDAGCYSVHTARFLAGAEPSVQNASAKLRSRQVDRRMEANLIFPGNISAHITCSLFSRTLFRVQAVVHGESGVLNVINPMLPHYFHLIRVRADGRNRWEHVPGEATYTYQLRAFAEAVRTGVPPITDARDAVANMRVIDDIYTAAGLQPRGQ